MAKFNMDTGRWEIEMPGGVLTLDGDGQIRHIDDNGNTENIWNPDDEEYSRYQEYFVKTSDTLDLVKLLGQLTRMNDNFGKGTIKRLTINCDDSEIPLSVCGEVVRRFPGGMQDDTRMFKVENGHLTFLSHKRKLKEQL